MHKIFILGPQGSGKGTQANILAAKLGVPALSMGQLLRDRIAEGDEFAKNIEQILTRGDLVSDKDALMILQERLAKSDAAEGFVLDGYPRNLSQLAASREVIVPTHVIVLNVSREIAIERLRARAGREQRHDDTPEAMNRRLQIYEENTKPMLEEFRSRGVVHDVDGVGTVDEVAERIWQIFDKS